MHCRSCGVTALPTGQYCSGCGDDRLAKKEFLQLEAKVFPYCKGCGSQNEKGSIHCATCGNSLLQYGKKSNSSLLKTLEDPKKILKPESLTVPKMDIASVIKSIQPKYILASFGGAFAFLFIVFLIISVAAKNQLTEIAQELGDVAYILDNMSEEVPGFYDKILGAPFLFLQSLGATFYAYSTNEPGSFGLYAPFFGLGFLLAIVFYFAGKVVTLKTNSTSLVGAVLNSLAIGILFALASTIVSFFAKDSVTIDNVTVKYGISTSSSIWNAFLVGTLFTLIGSIAQQAKNGNSLLATVTKSAWLTNICFIIGIFIVTIFVVSAKGDVEGEGSIFIALLLTLSQWIMVPFGSFEFNMQSDLISFAESFHTKISMGSFKEIPTSTEGYYGNPMNEVFAELSFVQTITIISLIVLLVYVAYLGYSQASKLQLATQFAALKLSLLFGFAFSFIMACWMKFVEFGLSGSDESITGEVIVLAPELWRNAFIAFIVISIAHYIGTYWRLHKNGIKW